MCVCLKFLFVDMWIFQVSCEKLEDRQKTRIKKKQRDNYNYLLLFNIDFFSKKSRIKVPSYHQFYS